MKKHDIPIDELLKLCASIPIERQGQLRYAMRAYRECEEAHSICVWHSVMANSDYSLSEMDLSKYKKLLKASERALTASIKGLRLEYKKHEINS